MPSREQASNAISAFLSGVKVSAVNKTEIKDIYEIVLDDNGRVGIVYMNSESKYIFTGSMLDVNNKLDLTAERIYEATKVDFDSIPLTNSIKLGAPNGQYKVVVFSDPGCKPCALYHAELRNAVRQRNDLTIYLMISPLPNLYPDSYEKAHAIACAKDNEEALARLENYYVDENVSYDECQTDAVDETLKLAAKLKIMRSPTTIFPNGVKIAEAMRTSDFLNELEKRSPENTQKTR